MSVAAEFPTEAPLTEAAVVDAAAGLVAEGPRLVGSVDAIASLTETTERLRRLGAVAVVDAMESADRSGLWRDQGHGSARAMVAHLGSLSGGEAFRLDRIRRMVHSGDADVVAACWRLGRVSVERAFVLAKIYANPRVREQFVADQDWFVGQAKKLSFKKFERRIARWVELADEDGPEPKPDPSHERRDVNIAQDHFSKAFHLRGQLGSLAGSRFGEVFDAYVDAEFATDWETAKAEHGSDVTRDQLARTDAQRRADALCQMAEDAAANANASVRVKRVHNLVWQGDTAEELFRRWAGAPAQPLTPDTAGTTDLDGNPIHAGDAFADLLTNSFRRVIQTPASVTIDLSHEHRLYTGLTRLGVELSADECYWPGCHLPTTRCQIDHLRPAARGGPTNQHNGLPACTRHNRLKEAGYTVTRLDDGSIHITTPLGDTVR